MRFVLRLGLVAIAATAVIAAGCSGPGGILNNPSGSIVLTDAATGNVLPATSNSSPFLLNPPASLEFSIKVSEAHFGGPYSSLIVGHHSIATASNGGFVYPFLFSQPCFTLTSSTNSGNAVTTLTFSGTNANGQPYNYPSGSPTPGPSGAPSTDTGDPCHSGEIEQAAIDDGHGHTVNFYYEEP